MGTVSQPNKIGKYEILSTLGRGGMGVVYKARDPMIDRIVAIKTILVGAEAAGDESLLDRLHMEARSAGRLQHPNIVTVYDFGEQDELSYIVMEYVEGINLARLIDERRPLALDSKVGILIQVADGLGYAHEHGVVHRDMKPSNVCVTARGTAKILDFGLARFDSTRLTKTGYMAGTIAYMSPERLSGETGPKDDIFALGAIAYELLTYQRAFAGTMAPEVIHKIIAPTPPRNPSEIAGIPAELDPIVQKALAKDIDQRYENAAALARDLRAFMRSEAMNQYLVDEQRPTIDRSVVEFIDDQPSGHAYGGPSSSKRSAGPPPTMRMEVPEAPSALTEKTKGIEPPHTEIAPTVRAVGPKTLPDVETTETSEGPTQVVPVQTSPPRWWFGVAAAVIILIVAAVFVLRNPAPAEKTSIAVKKLAPAPPSGNTTTPSSGTLTEKSELQLATARSLAEELSRRSLNSDEMMQFSESKARIALAEKKLNAKDYEASARLIADAITGLQGVMSTSGKRLQQNAPPPVVESRTRRQPREGAPRPVTVTAPSVIKPSSPLSSAVVTPQPTVAESRPTPVPEPQPPKPQPQIEAPRPAAEPPEKEIAGFIRQLAVAYQGKDVEFFREHSLRFNDQLANAIRNSPSMRVELQIVTIDVHNPQHASVHVKRTDWFPDPAAPAATQRLIYSIQRGNNGWMIVSMSRE